MFNSLQLLAKGTVLATVALAPMFATAAEKTSTAREPVVTQREVAPVLYLRCTVCHGLRRQEAGLDLRSRESMLRGGKSGPALVPGKPEESLILKRISSGQMPPPRRLVELSVKPMPPNELELLRRWIAQGAPEGTGEARHRVEQPPDAVSDEDRQFWAFRPPIRHAPPVVRNRRHVRNAIDAFVLAKLQAEGLAPSGEADRPTLLRRACFDLTGLPPTPEEARRFLDDTDPLAYERLIDRLLASPRYGERWGRYWLDLAGYADSEGVQHSDPVRPHAWRYRDYVIRAFNADKPYDRFLLEQLAGDELADAESAGEITPEIYDNLVATGMLRMAPDGTWANITGFVPDRLDVINDEIEILSSAVMGLTLRCARCHAHKFDPIPQRDYYRLAAIFKGAYDEHDWLKPYETNQFSYGEFGTRLLTAVTTAERRAWESHNGKLDASIAELERQLARKAKELAAKYREKRLAGLPGVLHDDLRTMLATPPENRNAVQKYLAEKFEAMLSLDQEALEKVDAQFKKTAEGLRQQSKLLRGQRRPEPKIRALWDRGEPSPSYVLTRGNYLTPGEPVEPGVPAVLSDPAAPLEVKPPWPGAKKTGRRLAFARWLTRPEHPLTARVMVNRIWKHHFGTGIVATLDNFGKTGAPPSHPELLDRLAAEFVQGGWSVKAMHWMIMTSATYRQSSLVSAEQEQRDPENRLLSRMPLLRLDAEALRDSLHFIAGRLDLRPFGPADPVESRADGLVTSAGSATGWRRSIYLLQRRTQIPTILESFDLPRMNPNCIERPESNVAPQALFLLNNRRVRELADDFARRVVSEVGADPRGQIARVYLIALSRAPTAEELSISAGALAELTRGWNEKLAGELQQGGEQQAAVRALGNFCHAMMNTAMLIYLD